MMLLNIQSQVIGATRHLLDNVPRTLFENAWKAQGRQRLPLSKYIYNLSIPWWFALLPGTIGYSLPPSHGRNNMVDNRGDCHVRQSISTIPLPYPYHTIPILEPTYNPMNWKMYIYNTYITHTFVYIYIYVCIYIYTLGMSIACAIHRNLWTWGASLKMSRPGPFASCRCP